MYNDNKRSPRYFVTESEEKITSFFAIILFNNSI